MMPGIAALNPKRPRRYTLQEETKARGARKVEIVNLGLEPWEGIAMDLEVENVDASGASPSPTTSARIPIEIGRTGYKPIASKSTR